MGTANEKSPLSAFQGAQSLKSEVSVSAVTGEPPMRGVIRGLVASSGSGCDAVLMSHSASGQPPCWTSRLHPAQEESFCSLELRRYPCSNLQVKVTFADAASTAKSITFAHGKSPGVWEKLGSMPLRSHGSSCLQHVIKLGAHTQVHRYLRITLQGLLQPPRDGSTFHGSHRIVRLRVVAPVAAVNHSASESISAYWPSKSVARSTADSQEAGSIPVELPADRPGNDAMRDGMRSSGPLGSHMAARPHLVPALPPSRSRQAVAAPDRHIAGSNAKDDGHLVALTPSACRALPQAEAEAAGDGRSNAETAPAPLGVRKGAPPPPPPPPPKLPGPPGGHKAPPRAPPPPPPPPRAMASSGPSRGALPVGGAAKGPPRPPPPPPPPGKPGGARAGAPPPPPLPSKGALGKRPPSQAAPQSGPSAPDQAALVAGPTPSKPMVKLFWDKLPDRQLENTVWGKLGKSPAEVDYEVLEDEFAAKQAVMQLGNGGGAQQRPKQAMLLPLQRAQNVGVFLTRLKMGPAEVKEAILGMVHGQGSLSTEDISGLLRCLPSADEREMLQRHSARYAELGMAEQFMLSMMSISQVGQRLRAVQFQRQFDGRHEALHAQIQTLEDASAETRSNRLLPCVLKTCLDVGNYLNAGHRAGAAAGFQIESLLKLKAVRSSKHPGRTLLHFVARQVAKKLGEEMPIEGGLQRVAAAAKVSLSAMQSELQDLSASCAQLHRLLESLALPGLDPFVEEMRAFHAEADLSIEKLQLQLASAQEQFAQLAAYVNGAAKTSVSDPQAFFTMLLTFARDLDSAHRDNLAADEQSRKRAKKTAAAKGGASQGGAMKQRDRMLSQVKAYQRLRPEDRRALLTDKGARERLQELGLNERASVPSLRLVLAAEAAAEAAAAAPCSAAKRMRSSLRLPLSSHMAGMEKGPSPMPSARRSMRPHRDGLAARSLCIPLGATGRGGMQESLAKASRAAQSGLRARQKDLQAADAPDVGTEAGMASLNQAADEPSGVRKSVPSAHQHVAGDEHATMHSEGQPSSGAQADTGIAGTDLSHTAQEQHRADSGPLPTAGTTPESLPSGGRGHRRGSDSAEQMQHIDLFQQLGPRPLQSLAASGFAMDPSHQNAPAQQGSQAEEHEVNPDCSAPAVPTAAEEAAVDLTTAPTMHPHDDEGSDSADKVGSGQSTWASQQGAKQAKQSMPPALPVVPEASAEGSPGGAEKSTRGGLLRRSLLPAVHPRFRSSPLRTPAVIQSLSMLPDQATTAQSGQSQGPGSSDVIISSSWDRSAKQGSLQQRLQEAAVRLMGTQPSRAKAGNLGLRLHEAAMEADAASSPSGGDNDTQQEHYDNDKQGLGGAQKQQQRRPMALPKRPPSIRKTPLPGSAQRAPALDMHAVESSSRAHSITQYSPNMSELLGFVPTPKIGGEAAAAERPAQKPSVTSSYSFSVRDRPGSTGSTPVLYPGSGSAAEAVPAPLRSASPKQLGRPRSAGRDIVSHPVRLSDHSAEDAGAVREPLGHSLDRGALQQMGLSQDSERKRVFNDIGASGHISDSLALIASMRISPGPLGKSADPRGPITYAVGAAGSAQAVASQDHSGITPLLNGRAAGTVANQPLDSGDAAALLTSPSPSGSGLGDIDARLCCQPLRGSLFLHSLEDSVDAAASLSLTDYSDCPGPLEAGHLRARDLILTPAECKGKRNRRRWQGPPSESAAPPCGAEAQAAEPDLMLFTPQAAARDEEAAAQPGQATGRPPNLKTGKQPVSHPWWSGRRWRRVPNSQVG